MKNSFGYLKALLIVLAIALMGVSAQAQIEISSHEQIVSITGLKVPTDLEQGSMAYVFASGIFPNGCYRLGDPRVNHVSDRVHEIAIVASVQEDFCIMSLVPFVQRVNLGLLERGQHLIRVLSGDRTYVEKELVIR